MGASGISLCVLHVVCLMLHALGGHPDLPGLQVMTALSVAKEAMQRKAVSAQPKALAQKAMEQGRATFTVPEVCSNGLSTCPVQSDACSSHGLTRPPLPEAASAARPSYAGVCSAPVYVWHAALPFQQQGTDAACGLSAGMHCICMCLACYAHVPPSRRSCWRNPSHWDQGNVLAGRHTSGQQRDPLL